MKDQDLKMLYQELDKAVSQKDMPTLKDFVQKALNEKSLRYKRAVYQYAGLYSSEIVEIKELEGQLTE